MSVKLVRTTSHIEGAVLTLFALLFSVQLCSAEVDLPVITESISAADAVDIALKNSPVLASGRAILGAAEARIDMAKSMQRLQVSTTSYASKGNMPMVLAGPDTVMPQSSILTGDTARFDQSIMGMYPIYTGGRIESQIAAFKSLRQASEGDLAASELDVSYAAQQAYYSVLLLEQYVSVYQQRVDESQERLRLAQESYDAGKIAKYDLLRNQTELADSKQLLNNAKRDAEISFINLKNTLGIAHSSQLTLTQKLQARAAVPKLADLQEGAAVNRPELAALKARVQAAHQSLELTKSAYKPQVYASAMLGATLSKSTEMNSSFDKSYLIGVTAALPILDGGLRKSAVDEAEAMLLQVKADEMNAALNISRDVSSAYIQFNTATENLGLAQTAIDQAEEDYRVIRLRYESGKGINVEVLDALTSLTRAKTAYAEALYNQNIAAQAIARAVGKRSFDEVKTD